MNTYKVWVAYPVSTPESAHIILAETSFDARKRYAELYLISQPWMSFRDCAASREFAANAN